jgi:putative spermidine/putrescine transport system permease protein
VALPAYTTPGQRLWHYCYLAICALVLFFLVAPLITVIPLSFTSSAFLSFTSEMLAFDPEAFSLRWYRIMIGDCSDPGITTVCSDKWKDGAVNSVIIAVCATALATTLGTLASLALSRPYMPYSKAIMAIMISPLIVPLIITAAGMFLFFAQFRLNATFTGLILAHTVLGLPFVVITVTATLVGFDTNLTKAAEGLGGGVLRNFFKVQLPLIAPGVISGGLFAFITSFDEVVVVLFIGSSKQQTLPRQMWSGIRQEISPTILAVATILVILSILLLTTVELLRRRSERLRGVSPS